MSQISLVGREAIAAWFNASTKYMLIALISIYPSFNQGISHVILALKVIDKKLNNEIAWFMACSTWWLR